jgi:hypothetical protein
MAVFFGGKKIRAIFKPYFNRLYKPMPVVKNGARGEGETFWIYSALKV